MTIKAIIFDCFGVLYVGGEPNLPLLDYIHKLKPRYKLGVVSNSNKETLDHLLATAGIREELDVVVASSEIGIGKPEYAIFAYAIKQLDVGLADILFIDDQPTYVEAARNFGMHAYQYRSFEELEAFLKRYV